MPVSEQCETGEVSAPFNVELRFNSDGLIPVIVQQTGSGEVLMLAWMDAEAISRTLITRCATYWSRSRQEYWVKGETSGHTQKVISLRHDCDADTLLLEVEQTGAACHTNTHTCFDFRDLEDTSDAAA